MARKKIEKNRGRGRPRKDRHLADYRAAGEPPRDDVLAIGHWLYRIVAITAYQAQEGRGTVKMRKAIRASCQAAARLLPSTYTARALGLADEDEEIRADGPPPSDPLAISEWFLLNLVDDVHRQITGTADEKISAEWRAASAAGVKVWPPDLMVEARRMLQQAQGELDAAVDAPESEAFADDAERPGSLNLH